MALVLHSDPNGSRIICGKRLWEVTKGSAGQQWAWQERSWEVTDTGVGEASRWSSGSWHIAWRPLITCQCPLRTSPEHPSRQNSQLACYHDLGVGNGYVKRVSVVVGGGHRWASAQQGLSPAATPPRWSVRHFGARMSPRDLVHLAEGWLPPPRSPCSPAKATWDVPPANSELEGRGAAPGARLVLVLLQTQNRSTPEHYQDPELASH